MKKFKTCPLLERCGVSDAGADGNKQLDKDEIKICTQCPLQQCVYDYSSAVTKGDRARLELYYFEMVKERGKLWWRMI